MDVKKVIAVSVMAMFCVSGYLMVEQEDGSAEVGYVTHLEFYGEKNTLNMWGASKYMDKKASFETFVESVSDMIGYKQDNRVDSDDGEITLVRYDGTTFERGRGIDDEHYYGFVMFYLSKGAWKPFTDGTLFTKETYIALGYSQFISEDEYRDLTPEEQKDLTEYQHHGERVYVHRITETQPEPVKDLFIFGAIAAAGIIIAVIALLGFAIYRRRSPDL